MHGTASGSAEIQGPVSFGFGSMLPSTAKRIAPRRTAPAAGRSGRSTPEGPAGMPRCLSGRRARCNCLLPPGGSGWHAHPRRKAATACAVASLLSLEQTGTGFARD